MNVLNFVKQNGLEALKTQYSIKIKTQVVNDKISYHILNYSTKSMNDIVSSCRGLVLKEDTQNGFSIVYNCNKRTKGEYMVKKISPESVKEIESCDLAEKLDGSFIKLFWDEGRWNLGTRAFAFLGETNVYVSSFFKAIGFTGTVEEFSKHLDDVGLPKENSYMFEVVSPINQIIVKYSNFETYALNVINTSTGDFVPVPEILQIAFPKIKTPQVFFKSGEFTIEDVELFLLKRDSGYNNDRKNLFEGFIAYNQEGVPIYKIKSSLYCSLYKTPFDPEKVKNFDLALAHFKKNMEPEMENVKIVYNDINEMFNKCVKVIEMAIDVILKSPKNEYNNLKNKYGKFIFCNAIKMRSGIDVNTIRNAYSECLQKSSLEDFKLNFNF